MLLLNRAKKLARQSSLIVNFIPRVAPRWRPELQRSKTAGIGSVTLIRTVSMPKAFSVREVIELDTWSISSEQEVVKIPTAYDKGGKPPRFRVVLRSGTKTKVCDTLEKVARAISELDLPIAIFAERYPGQVAFLITRLAHLRWPVQDHPLYQFVETDYGLNLKDVIPKVVDGVLCWREVPKWGEKELPERRLSLSSFSLCE